MDTGLNQRNKQYVCDFWDALQRAGHDEAAGLAKSVLAPDHAWHGPDPIGELEGVEEWAVGFWQPLIHAFPDLRRRCHIVFGGASNGRIDGTADGRMWVGGTGCLDATFENDYLAIPASGKPVSIRWGEFCRLEDGSIVETFLLLDLVDLMQQAGFQVLPPSRGVDGVYPPPAAGDGLLLDAQDERKSAHTLAHIRRFVFDALNSYDQSELKSMGIADYFHPDVHWYGPGGIGACLGFAAFEEHHQKHWLRAFPDRQVQDLDALIAEGHYSGGPGWAGVRATHMGDYLDVAATHRPVVFNGLDFWKLENERYVENWVFVDMVHLFRQLGVDLFGRLEEQAGTAE